MSLELIWNVKISADSTFSFLAIESNRKRGMGGISRKGHLRRKESDQSYFFWKEVEVDVKVFNFKILAKIRCLIQEPCKLSCCGRKNILVVTIINLLKSVKCRIFKFDKNLWKWLKILNISPDSALSLWSLWSRRKCWIGRISRKATFMKIILDNAFWKVF